MAVTQTPAQHDASRAADLDASPRDRCPSSCDRQHVADRHGDPFLLEGRPVGEISSDTSPVDDRQAAHLLGVAAAGRRVSIADASALQERPVVQVLGDVSRPDPRRLGAA